MDRPHSKPATHLTSLKLLALILALACTSNLYGATQQYQLTDLGIDVTPKDINNFNTVVGARRVAYSSDAVMWSPSTGLKKIAKGTSANAINDNGQIAGTTSTGAFFKDRSTTTWNGYSAYGINELGQISGNLILNNPYRPSPKPRDPALYTPNQWQNLGIARTYPRGTRQGIYADMYLLKHVNDNGYSVGSWRRIGLTGSSSILMTPAFDALTYLPIPSGGFAYSINNQNMIVGVTGDTDAHAYLYDYNNAGFTDLGTLANGLRSSAADINESNQIVGNAWLVTQPTSAYDPTLYHAFIWENGVMTDLNDLFASNPDWILTAATAINDNGSIVGTALVNGQAHGFLLTPQ